MQGVAGSEKRFGDPVEAALRWQDAGAEWIHLVDLDAAFGRGNNRELQAEIVGRLDIDVEMSGGIRDDESLAAAMKSGCRRVNIGTAALEKPEWCAAAIAEYGDRVAVGLDVRGRTLAARGWTRESGDLYEVLRISDSRVVVALGDVSGKGIPAALFMAVAVTVLRTLARQIDQPDEILRRLNDELVEQNPRGMFVTLQCMVFDLADRSVTCASAGHHAAARVVPGQAPQLVFTTSGRVLGLLPADDIDSEKLTLQPGETLVLFTDGVSEAFDRNQELFGEERLLGELTQSCARGASEITTGVVEAVRRHAATAKQSDDITIVSVRYAPER